MNPLVQMPTNSPDGYVDALDKLDQLATGNPNLNSHPGLMTAVATSGATGPQAGEIDQFLAGVKAQNMYNLARVTGGRVDFTDQERQAMNAMGFDYSAVDAQAATNQTQTIASLAKQGLAPQKNPDGTFKTDANGQIQTVAQVTPLNQPQPQHHRGLFGDITHGIGTAFHATVGAVTQAANVIDYGLTSAGRAANILFGNTFSSGYGTSNPSDNGDSFKKMHDQLVQDMTANGYNPNSVWSQLAFVAKGYAKLNTQQVRDQWDQNGGQQKYGVDGNAAYTLAEQYLKDPKGFLNNFYANNTPDQIKQQSAMLESDDFKQMIQGIAARQASFGNYAMSQSGIDPVKQSTTYALGSAGYELASSMMTDPTLLLGKGLVKLARTPISINGLSDAERIANLLDPANKTLGRGRLLNGWQSFIDNTNTIRSALDAGDSAKAAGAYAAIKAATPALEPLVGDFLGGSQATWRTTADGITGLGSHLFANSSGEAITNLADASKYLAQKGGLIRLASGKAAVEGTYMPGAISQFGYRALRGNLAAHVAEKSVLKSASQDAEYLAARNAGTLGEADKAVSDAALKRADPGTPTHTIDLSKLSRYLPTSIDGVDASSGLVVAAPDATLIGQHVDDAQKAYEALQAAQKAALKNTITDANGEERINPEAFNTLQGAETNLRDARSALASAVRNAAQRAPQGQDWASTLLPAEKGQVQYNLRRFGSAVAPQGGGLSIGGWSSPTAVAARMKLATARWTNLLPRNTKFNPEDPNIGDQVYKYARFYLGKGESSRLGLMASNGDLATRKAIVEGLWQQVAHAAGLSKTDAGRELMDRVGTKDQVYTHVGPGWNVDGQYVAQHEGQTTKVLQLPSFKALNDAAAKVGLFEGTVGRVARSTAADTFSGLFKFATLLAPKTAYRNINEPYLKAILDGEFGKVLQARALTYSSAQDLQNLARKAGADISGDAVPPELVRRAEQHLQQLKDMGAGSHKINVAQHLLDRINAGDMSAISGFARTRLGSRAADSMAHLTGWYHRAVYKTLPDEWAAHAHELPEVLPDMVHGYGEQVVGENFDPFGSKGVRDVSESGLQPAQIEYNLGAGSHPLVRGGSRRVGFGPESTDHSVGMDRYINALSMRTHDAPEITKAVIEHLRAGTGDLTGVIKALDEKAAHGGMTGYGRYFKPAADQSEAIRAIGPDEIAQGKTQWAQDLVNDWRFMLEGQNGHLNEPLMNHLGTFGTAPDAKQMSELLASSGKHSIPASVLAPQYEATPIGGLQNLGSALQDISGRSFNQIVEGTIKRQSSMPFLAAHYLGVRAEQDANGVLQKVMEGGLTQEAADTLLKGQAIRQAFLRVEQMIDDPGLKTQFDVVARNLFMFPRAMNAFIRRWGGSLAKDPTKARKLMLAMEAGEHSGLVYNDENGEPTFTYPGSQVMRDAMVALSKVPGFENFAKFPVGMDLLGKAMLVAPGIDNPLRFSMSPMVNIPMREIFKLFPEHQSLFTEVDTALNGDIGQGRGVVDSLEPSSVRNFLNIFQHGDGSAFASAVNGAIANLYAAGYVPGPGASPSEQEQFKARLKTQVRNQMALRFMFGLVAPAPPSGLQENIDQSAAKPGGSGTASDYLFHYAGIRSLDAEYKTILNAVNGDTARATQIWSTIHPEALAYTVAKTGSGINKAYLPATKNALGWMQNNLPFLDKYSSVAAYFIPKDAGTFDRNAYNAQMALGVRQQKGIDKYFQDVQTQAGLNEYYQTLDQYNTLKAQALASGDANQLAAVKKGFTAWQTEFLNQHLFVKEKFADTSKNAVIAQQQVQDLQAMVNNNDVPDGLAPQVQDMLNVFQQYNDWKSQRVDDGSTTSAVMTSAADDWLSQQMLKIANSDPRLMNIYNAVFRTIDNKLQKVS